MKKTIFILCALSLALLLSSCGQSEWQLASPDGSQQIIVSKQKVDGQSVLTYRVLSGDRTAIEPSRLGIVRADQDFSTGLAFVSAEPVRLIDENYELKSGKRLSCVNRANEMVLNFKNKENTPFQVILRAYDDGVAFRYGFPAAMPDETTYTINAELTEFAVPTQGKAWIHPYDWNNRLKPSYERYSRNEIAIGSGPGHDKGWAFPMLFNTNDLWMMITEAYLDGTYPATHIDNSGTNGAYKIRFPEIEEPIIPDAPEPQSVLPWYTPWRAIIVGKDLNTIFATNMVQSLNPASVIGDDSWVRAGRSSWSWWYDGSTSRSYRAQVQMIDMTRDMTWDFTLIDAGWGRMADGGTMEDVVAYANRNDVGVWLWYHSGAGIKPDSDSPTDRNTMSVPEARRAEMKRIHELGVKGIKVDFFDTDKQRIIQLYPAIAKDAADFQLMVNFHGATLPRGFERTYPNVMTTEAVLGAEMLGRQYYADTAALHNTVIPFTRNVVGSMDYTPVTFSDKIRQGIPSSRRTTVAHQLALSVVFESGFHCFADRAEAYLALPDAPKNFLREVPVAWDESRLLGGYPGDYAVIARRKGDVWYLGCVNGTGEDREIQFALPAECAGKTVELIADGADLNAFADSRVTPEGNAMKVKVLARGGFAAAIR